MSTTSNRRLILVPLFAICVAAVVVAMLGGCATPAELCNMRDEVDVSTAPISFRVDALVQVVTPAEARYLCTPIGPRRERYGCNVGTAEHGLIYITKAPRFSDVCSLAELGHEVLHPHGNHQ